MSETSIFRLLPAILLLLWLPAIGAAEAHAQDARDALFAQAAEALRAGDPTTAASALERLIEEHESVHAMARLAWIYARVGEHGRALELSRRALEQAPNAENLLALYGRSALAVRRPALALRPLSALTRMVPEDAEYPYLLGAARMQVGLLSEAEETLSRAVEHRPDHSLSHIALGMTLNRLKEYDRAAAVLERALQLDPKSAEALAALAETMIGLSRMERAEELAERVLAQDPDQAVANLALGMVRMKQRRFEEARAALERSVRANPGSAKSHYQLSLALARVGDAEGSERHRELYRKALEDSEKELLELRSVSGRDEPR